MKDKYQKEDRDISWLAFNYRVLQEANDPTVPLYERIKFIAIYSSNLDEFFRVRVASLLSLVRLGKKKVKKNLDINPKKLLKKIHNIVGQQLDEFGSILREKLIPELRQHNIHVYFNENIPGRFDSELNHYFRSKVLAFMRPKILDQKDGTTPFLKNKAIYFAVSLANRTGEENDLQFAYVKIPSDQLSRFYQIRADDGFHFILLDDIVKKHIDLIFPEHKVISCYSIKLNKSAELNIEDEYTGNLAEKIAQQLNEREIGAPSRFLFDANMDDDLLFKLKEVFAFSDDELIPGGRYHNLNDFFGLPNPLAPALSQEELNPLPKPMLENNRSLFKTMDEGDCILHFPYHSYDYVLRFFNEAAIDPRVEEIKVTLYRMGKNSIIANALISAAKNGKKVTVFVELKARFDEENNIKWGKKMNKAGVNIIYSIPGLKVHAKVALVKRRDENNLLKGYGFFGTGNFNENTASIYADHGLLTTHKEMVTELDHVFSYLQHREKHKFSELLVAQFNLKNEFLHLIDQEISLARQGKKGKITIKLNNLEETDMIDKLYEASEAGVEINLIVRSICCIIPQLAKISENINIYRLVDTYLEHARIFLFHNDGNSKMYLSSADWMHRNLNRRIEVGFPIHDHNIKEELIKLLDLQLSDNTKLKKLDAEHHHIDIATDTQSTQIRAQYDFYNWIKEKLEMATPGD